MAVLDSMSSSEDDRHPPPNDRVLTHLFFTASEAAHDRASVPSGILSLLLHALILLLFLGPIAAQHHIRKIETDPGVGTGIGAGLAGGGGGGSEQVTMIDLAAPAIPEPAPGLVPPPPPPPDPQQLVLPQPTKVALSEVRIDSVPGAVTASAAAGGQGTGSGPGSGPGTGPGSGGGSGGGEGGGIGSGVGPGIGRGRLLSPVPDFMLLPPMPTPGGVRGKKVVVRLAIDAAGTVNEVELIPSTGDRGYDQALRRTAMGWRFRPARDAANRPVPATYDVEFSL